MEELLPFYERELAFLRDYGPEFAKGFPKIASRLAASADRSEDPNVDRIIQSFALLTSRISKKLDDDYPEFTEALLEILYPHYLRPFPSCTIARFEAEAALEVLQEGGKPVVVKRGIELTTQPAAHGIPCRFRTCYEVTLAPVRIADVVFHPALSVPAGTVLPKDATCSLSISVEAVQGQVPLHALGLDRLRVFIDAEASLATALTDALFLRTAAVFIEPDRCGQWTPLNAPILHEVGFDEADALIELPARAHPAYRFLTEYFAYPEKFNFFDIDWATAARFAQSQQTLTIHLVMRGLRADSPTARMLEAVTSRNLQLGCTPVINLFASKG
ncbi:MAG: type VI secretion system baseplate subunit TssF, partial [Burkholderiaceae bacterium]|nr:type VI secretion system baseplate subunit TssF [Burkholderiaceae bacterium]